MNKFVMPSLIYYPQHGKPIRTERAVVRYYIAVIVVIRKPLHPCENGGIASFAVVVDERARDMIGRSSCMKRHEDTLPGEARLVREGEA